MWVVRLVLFLGTLEDWEDGRLLMWDVAAWVEVIQDPSVA